MTGNNGGVIVLPWGRGSKRRLYVKDPSQKITLGWVNPKEHTGELYTVDRATEYVAALYNYGVPREVTINVVATATSRKRENLDLSKNLPGAAAREKADELVQGMSRAHAEIVRGLGFSSVEQTWELGARGEELVGGKLDEELGSNWKVLHSVPVGDEGADIDHLVIGPSGVYSVNTKNHPGSSITCAENKVRVEGQSMSKNHPYARNSRFEARRASKILSIAMGTEVPVHGLVVFICESLDVMNNPKDGKVAYLCADDVTGWLKTRNQVYPDKSVERIFDKARWSDTWQVK